MSLRTFVLISVLAACATPTPDLSVRRGPRASHVDPLADPFAERRDVSSTPAAFVSSAGCQALLFAGPRACLVRAFYDRPPRPVRHVVTDGGAVLIHVDFMGEALRGEEPSVEYWLDCGATATPCDSPLRCVCGDVAE